MAASSPFGLASGEGHRGLIPGSDREARGRSVGVPPRPAPDPEQHYIAIMPGLRVCIDVDDLDAGVAFYTRALGLTPGRRAGDEWAEVLGATCPIDLLAKPPGTSAFPGGTRALRAYERHWTPVHLDVIVDDVDAAVDRAVAAGAKLERGIQEEVWGKIAILGDPFGHGFCLLEFRGRGYDELP